MFKQLMSLLHSFKYKPKTIIHSDSSIQEHDDNIPLLLTEAEVVLKEIFSNDKSLILRPIKIRDLKLKGLIIYIDGLTDTKTIELNVVKPLMTEVLVENIKNLTNKHVIEKLIKDYIQTLDCSTTASLNTVVDSLLSGTTILLIEGENTAIQLNSKKWETRGIAEPQTEAVIRGPREGFNEDLQTNITLMRRKFKSPKLKFESITLGKYSKTAIAICYLEGIADNAIIMELKRRIETIQIDTVLESGYIEQFIEDNPLSPFPTVGNSEKPDVVIGKLMEGRVAVLCDGTPFVLIVPRLFIENIQTSEDYYTRPLYATILRFLRVLALFITTTLPALYVAVQTFHHEIIPFRLFIALTAAREGIPMPSVLEALMMVIIFELINEGGLRMPKSVGQAVSIVGAIVLGQATVEAGIASPLMVIVIALTAISSFVIPSLHGSFLLLRVYFLFAGSILGFYGIVFAMVTVFIHICNIKSFGIEYLSPIAPLTLEGLKDTYVRPPLWTLFFDSTSVNVHTDENPTQEE